VEIIVSGNFGLFGNFASNNFVALRGLLLTVRVRELGVELNVHSPTGFAVREVVEPSPRKENSDALASRAVENLFAAITSVEKKESA
jgi:hypothetical protein